MTTGVIVLMLPTPPSVNSAYRNVTGRGRVKTAAYTEWEEDADEAYIQQKRGVRPILGVREIEIRIPDNTKGDITNRIKLLEDYLVSREITGDDKFNRKVSIERDVSLFDLCVVTVRRVGTTTDTGTPLVIGDSR
jgi:Holliday junction resolvase RusA-like endonuclease